MKRWTILLLPTLFLLAVASVYIFQQWKKEQQINVVQQEKIVLLNTLLQQQNERLLAENRLTERVYCEREHFFKAYQASKYLVDSLQSGVHIFRMTYSTAFCPTSFIYTISKRPDSAYYFTSTKLTFEYDAKKGFYNPILEKKGFPISVAIWDALEQRVEQSFF